MAEAVVLVAVQFRKVFGSANTSVGAGSGGVGKAYTIADGTTSVYYAGGGGGSAGR